MSLAVKLGGFVVLAAISSTANAQTLTTLLTFSGTNGQNPGPDLTLFGTTLYGMTNFGGTPEPNGNIYRVNTDGTGYQNVLSLGQTAGVGEHPQGSLTLSGSTLYGMTATGGTQGGDGTIFRINADGSGFQTLLAFSGTNGATPYGSLTLSGATLFGMTGAGGTSNEGTIFSINTDGSGFQNLLSFSGSNGNVSQNNGNLTLSGSTLYGMTDQGGPNNAGTIFRINADGSGFQTLLAFSGTNGETPRGSLTLSGSTLYGTTSGGGGVGGGDGTVFRINTDGTGFQNLFAFGGTSSLGDVPRGTLTLSGSTLYGTTNSGGTASSGTIFRINTDGSGFQNLASFPTSGAGSSAAPDGGLTLIGSTLYGTSNTGGTAGEGTVFAFTLPSGGTWATGSGGSWGNASKWLGSAVPPNNGTVVFAASTAGLATITLDGNRTTDNLQFGDGVSASTYQISAGSGGALTLTLGSITVLSGSQTIAAPIQTSAELNFVVDAASRLTVSGNIDQTFAGISLTFVGTGTLVLSGSNNYSGGTFVFADSAGNTLVVTNSASLGAISGALSIGQATLEIANSFADARNINLTQSGATIQVDPSIAYSNSGTLAGPGALTKTGSGELMLSGSNTYTGATNVESGTLVLNGASSLISGGSLTIGVNSGPGAVFQSPSPSAPNLATVPEPGTFALLAVAAITLARFIWLGRQTR